MEEFNIFNLGKIEKVSELWKKEKKEYRPWIIAWAVSLFVFFVLVLSANIVFLVDQNKVEQQAIIQDYISYISLMLLSLFTMVLYYFSVFKSYKNKNFAFLNLSLVIVLAVIAIFSIGSTLGWSLNQNNEKRDISSSEIILITSFIYLIVVIFIVYSKISKISKKFKQSMANEAFVKQMEELQKMNLFQNANNNPFSSFVNTNFEQQNNPTENNQNQNINPEDILEKEKINKLNELKIDALHKMAKDLEISGYENMSKEELIKIISKLVK